MIETEIVVPQPGFLAWLHAEDAGGGDAGGGDDGGGDDGTGGADDGLDDGTGDDGTGKPGEQGKGKDGKPGEDGKPDGRKTPDAIRKHLAEMKADAAKAPIAKAITDRLGKVRGYEEVYPTVREARDVKALLDSVGGKEAVTTAIASHATMQRVDSMLEAGDPAILDEIFKQAPEGMPKLIPHMLDKLAQTNSAAWEKAVTPQAVSLMANAGLPGAINALVDAFDADNKAGMKEILSRIVQWYSGLQQGAKPRGVDPDRAKFEEERTNFENQKADAAVAATFEKTTEYAGRKIDTELTAEIRRLGVTIAPKALQALRQDVWTTVQEMRNADSVYKNTLPTKFEGRKPKPEAEGFVNGYTDRLLKEAIRKVDPASYGSVAAKAAKDITAAKGKPGVKTVAGAAGTQTAGAIRVAAAPDRKDIDYDDRRTDVFKGVAVRKSDKKLVTWR